MNDQQKNKLGQYITSADIAELMISLASTKLINSPILEPCFGTGVFLNLLFRKGFQKIFGYELDENFFKIVQNNFPGNLSNFKQMDYLKSSQNEKFNLIIGNPPYVYYNNIEPEILEPLLKSQFWQKLMNGEWDLLYFFIVWSIEKLNPKGELIFITPYYWFNSTYASSLRKYILENGSFVSIIHFGEMNLFRGCAPNTIIFKFIKEKSNNPIKVIEYKKRTGDVEVIVSKLKEIFNDFPRNEVEDTSYRIFLMDQFDNPFFWYLIKPSEKKLCDLIENASLKNIPEIILQKNTLLPQKILLNKFLDEKDLFYFNLNKKKYRPVIKNRKKWYLIPPYENNYVKLKHILTVSVGMVTGFDQAFRINQDEFNLLTEIEKQHLIQCMKGQNCERFYTNTAEYYIYLDNINSNEELRTNFPYFYQKLIKYQTKLKKRYNVHNKEWFHWATIRNKDIFEKNFNRLKIFVPCLDRHKQSRFCLSTETVYGSGDTLAIVKYPHSFYKLKESLKYVVAWLNSSYIQKWYQVKGSKRGHRTQYTQSYLEEIPIRLINWDNQTEVSAYQNIIELIDEILREKMELSHLEKEINKNISLLIENN